MKRAESIPTMDDIIFEKRNKLYGAYELRKSYNSRLSKSFAVSIAFLLAIFFSAITRKKEIPPTLFTAKQDSVIFSQDYVIETYVQPEHGTKTEVKQVRDDLSFVAVADTEINHDDIDTVLATTESIGVVTGNDSTVGEHGDTLAITSSLPASQAPLGAASVDQIPEFPGGLEKFYAFLLKRIRYTRAALNAEVNGKMYVRFVIDEEGLVSNVSLMSKIGYGLDEQVQQVIAESPRWNPGLVKNSAVKTEMVLPVSFNLR